MVSVTVA
ncbi:uncharacterized protein FFNC_09396 [Fusarium fujikuroi]|nr:uncharacterized protein FFM5_06688 [Fusarium fujikuroi]SCO19685.1 uncharacterized protein FFC1_13658 [Fusarium fujikuroi]SCO43767.1 uncharacterized protein FFNC_09396 [Fusarium fujikuroi]